MSTHISLNTLSVMISMSYETIGDCD